MKTLDDILIAYVPDAYVRNRMLQEIEWALTYVEQFNHGTAGHLSHNVIAVLATALLAEVAQREEKCD